MDKERTCKIWRVKSGGKIEPFDDLDVAAAYVRAEARAGAQSLLLESLAVTPMEFDEMMKSDEAVD